MWNDQGQNSWYALFVATNSEEKVKRALDKRLGDSITPVVPKRLLKERKNGKWNTVSRILFPGYVLLNGTISIDTYYRLKDIPMLAKLLKDEIGPLQIPSSELRFLRRIIDDESGSIGISTILKENQKVRVINGPLMGMEGIIESLDRRKGRARVRMNFLGQEKLVQLGVDIVDKI